MEYRTSDRRPAHEISAWKQTMARWQQEAPEIVRSFTWTWMGKGEAYFGFDRREFVPVNFMFLPPFKREVLQETAEYEIYRDERGMVRQGMKAGAIGNQRMSMDHFVDFPVKTPADWQELKKRLVAGAPERYRDVTPEKIESWTQRNYVLCLGRNTNAGGFFWRPREYMGIENLSMAWYDHPEMMHDMMEYYANFIIETSKPILAQITPDYFTFSEDCAMKSGPLLSPEIFKEFIFPRLVRVVTFLKSQGIPYIGVDCDGNPTKLIPLWLEAGINFIWPVERAADASPMEWRRQFGKDLRIWGGVDKRILARDQTAIKAHLREFIPLIEQGGFIPTVDHSVPPDVSWENFRYYMELKNHLIRGEFQYLD